jgi:hypothetical protein
MKLASYHPHQPVSSGSNWKVTIRIKLLDPDLKLKSYRTIRIKLEG